MIIVEYRVPMPFCASEYRIGQLYTIAKKSKLESADSKNGVQINANEPYSVGPGGSGQYTNKTYYLANQLPDWIKRLLPESAAKLHEEAWNAYPYSKNRFQNPLLDNLTLEIESRYLDGPPTLANVFNLDTKEEKQRSIVMIDLANDKFKGRRAALAQPVQTGDGQQYQHQQLVYDDNQVLNFEPLFRAPLTRDWIQDYELSYAQNNNSSKHKHKHNLKHHKLANGCQNNADEFDKCLMTCYKLCRVSFPVWPIQNKVEQFIQQYCRDTIIESHRQTWLWQDEWTGMSLDDIRQMEMSTQKQLVDVMREKAFD